MFVESLSREFTASEWVCFYHAAGANWKNANIWGCRKRVIYTKTPMKMSNWRDNETHKLLRLFKGQQLNFVAWNQLHPIFFCKKTLSIYSYCWHENLPVLANLGDAQWGAYRESRLISWVLGVKWFPPTHMCWTAGGAVTHRCRLSWHFPNHDYCLQTGSVRGNQHPLDYQGETLYPCLF